MQKVTVLCVGRLKEKFYAEAAAEYAKRLSRFCKLEITELPEERLPEDRSPAQIEAALAKEADAVRAKLPAGAALIALCVEGESRSSEDLARQMDAWASQGAGQLVFLIGVVLVLAGVGVTIFKERNRRGIWLAGTGTVLAVLGLLLCVGWNGTAYYPSTLDLQSSLTLANSCSSKFTLRVMAWVSVLVPFVLAYIAYAWRAIDRKKLTAKEIDEGEHTY